MKTCGISETSFFVYDDCIYSYEELKDEIVERRMVWSSSPRSFEEVIEDYGIPAFDTYEDACDYLDELAGVPY